MSVLGWILVGIAVGLALLVIWAKFTQPCGNSSCGCADPEGLL